MLYLSEFSFPSYDEEYAYRLEEVKRTCYNTMYPFFVLSARRFGRVRFAPVTVFYGGNGSGKTTALNVIAEKAGLARGALYNRSDHFEAYLRLCSCKWAAPLPAGSAVVTSDDVFDFMLDLRAVNGAIDGRREQLCKEYLQNKYASFRMSSLGDYEKLKEVTRARSRTQSCYVRERLAPNVREHSNGESAFSFFTQKIGENALYLLDEPENSLSPERQAELARFPEDAVRFFGCQFIIATHSPFLLALRGAKIYDLDADPVCTKKWTQLAGVRAWRDFFRAHEGEFGEEDE